MENKVIYPELSYKIVGMLFEIWNEIGYSHKEKIIQNALAKSLNDNNIPYKKEEKVDLKIKNEKIGFYFLDFLIDNKLVLEINYSAAERRSIPAAGGKSLIRRNGIYPHRKRWGITAEIKKRNYFSKKDIQQLYSYLKATGLKLGIIAHFTNKGVVFKRVLNLN